MSQKNEKTRSEDPIFTNLIETLKEEYADQIHLLEKDIYDLPYSNENAKSSFKNLYNLLFKIYSAKCQKENQDVKELGGLFVLGTERHETRRIDNQLRGRAGRQGDPGASQFFVCLDDQLIQVFGGDGIRKWVQYLIDDKDVPLESNMLTQSLENAQKKVEMFNYDTRKNVFEYDNILNNQRKEIFAARQEILRENDSPQLFLAYSESKFNEMKTDFLATFSSGKPKSLNWYEDALEQQFDSYSYSFFDPRRNNDLQFEIDKLTYCEIWISQDLQTLVSNLYQEGVLKLSKIKNLLEIIDFCWTEHLERMNYIRETINWRSYGQQKPLVEYSKEASFSYNTMLQEIRMTMLYYFLENTMIQ